MSDFNNELILNHITHGEFVLLHNKEPELFEDYKKMALLFLNHKGKYLFKSDILSNYSMDMNFGETFCPKL
jgi:hypothetical protein